MTRSVAKFHRIVTPVCGEAWATQAYDTIMTLDAASTTARLSELLSQPIPQNDEQTESPSPCLNLPAT